MIPYINSLGDIGIPIFSLFLVISAMLSLWALVEVVIRNSSTNEGTYHLWFIFIIFFFPIGWISYFLVGKNQKDRT